VDVRVVAAVVIPVITMLLLSACSGRQKRQPVQFVPGVVRSPQEGRARPGGRLLLTRLGREAEALRMSNSIASTMPGTLGMPFNFSVQKSDLILEYQTNEHLYYVAPSASCFAYSMGTFVLAESDEIGVRVSRRDGSREWFVDNSVFNHLQPGSVLWSRPVEDSDGVMFAAATVLLPLKDGNIKYITFDGYAGNLLHFTYEEIESGYEISRQYVFRKDHRIPCIVNIEGAELVVLEASGDEIRYRALKGFN
jgi:hypothetical protein